MEKSSGSQIVLAVLALIFTACGSEEKPQEVLDVGEFAPYVERFEGAAASYGASVKVTNLVIRKGSLPGASERGLCEIAGEQTPVITLDAAYWNSASDEAREALIFHEMGHCVLRRKHKTGLNSDGVPASLMNPYTIDGGTFVNYENAYLTELFRSKGEF